MLQKYKTWKIAFKNYFDNVLFVITGQTHSGEPNGDGVGGRSSSGVVGGVANLWLVLKVSEFFAVWNTDKISYISVRVSGILFQLHYGYGLTLHVNI
jgi:hypothetical protein